MRQTLGTGGFGAVYRAHDPTLARDVALKLRHGHGDDLDYIDEARKLARVLHPNVLIIHGADIRDGRAGIWTELIDGQTLEEILERGPLSAEETIRVGVDLCKALAAVHSAGLIHGDIKSRNVMRARGGRVVLMDFGAVTEIGVPAIAGTPVALAPELLDGGAPTPASDIYSLGVLLYRLVTAEWPFADLSFGALQDPNRPVVPVRDRRADLPTAFAQVVERALSVSPTVRPASAGEMERALIEHSGRIGASWPARNASAGHPSVSVCTEANTMGCLWGLGRWVAGGCDPLCSTV